jgi:DNA polymerase-3 subunit delta
MKSSMCVVATDATLVYDALHQLIEQTLGDLDPSFALQDFTAKDQGTLSDQPVISAVMEALNTPPFLVERRVVVLRDAQHLTADEADALLGWIKNPTPDIYLRVGVVGPKTNKIVKAVDEVLAVGAQNGRDGKSTFVRDAFALYNVNVDAATLQLVITHFGDDLERVDALARTLQNIYGSAPLNSGHVSPYLGEVGNVPEWDLTDAIDAGNVSAAISIARRMLDSRGRAGLQIVNMVQRHYLRAARLEGLDLTPDGASELLGIAKFPAGKSAALAKKLGPDRLSDAIAMVAQADLDLKGGVSFGGVDLDSDQDITELTVVEVLVARLARLNAVRRR